MLIKSLVKPGFNASVGLISDYHTIVSTIIMTALFESKNTMSIFSSMVDIFLPSCMSLSINQLYHRIIHHQLYWQLSSIAMSLTPSLWFACGYITCRYDITPYCFITGFNWYQIMDNYKDNFCMLCVWTVWSFFVISIGFQWIRSTCCNIIASCG